VSEIETILDSYKSICAVCEENESSCEECCCGILIRAVEKQIPKNVEYHHKRNGDCALVICPCCENRIIISRNFFPLDRYCKNCGQHYISDMIDWRVEE
jgi:hypothetical protein